MKRIFINISKLVLFFLICSFFTSHTVYGEDNPFIIYIELDEKSSLQTNIEFNNFSYDFISYESQNNQIASIDENGKITANSPGEVKIYARAIEKLAFGSVIAEAKTIIVTVKACPVTSIEIPAKITLNGAVSKTLKAVVSPENAADKTIIWTSSKKSIASVNKNGIVTGIGSGTAKITASSADGKIKAHCTVTVKKIPLKNMTLSKNKITIRWGRTYTLKQVFTPSNTTEYTCRYKSSNTKVATVNSKGVITAKGKGSCQITITDKNNKKITATIIVPSPTLNDKIKGSPIYIGNELIALSSSGHICQFKLYNKSNNNVTFVKLQILSYDKKGNPVTPLSSYYEDVMEVAKGSAVTKNVLVNSSSIKARGCIISVKYEDGSTWKNPYYSEWSKKYISKYN